MKSQSYAVYVMSEKHFNSNKIHENIILWFYEKLVENIGLCITVVVSDLMLAVGPVVYTYT